MYSNCPKCAELLFAAADATWRAEAFRSLGRNPHDPHLAHETDAKGCPDSLLRTAYEVRQRALSNWESAIRAVELCVKAEAGSVFKIGLEYQLSVLVREGAD